MAMLPVCAKSIVSLTLIGILQNLVGFVDLFKLFFGISALVNIRVITSRKFAICFFDVAFIGISGDAQNLVVILVFHAG